MKTLSISTISFFLLLAFSCSCLAIPDPSHFLGCLSTQFKNYSSISNLVYTTTNSSYTSILQFSIRNQRFVSESLPKPQVIITPEHESQIPPLIICARQTGFEIRTRSGGHDFEGLSYLSPHPFVIIDFMNLSEITVDVESKTAWVGAGATLGQLYYRIAEKSPVLGFPAGFCPTVGVGGHFSGGGYGPLLRKYGLAGDNVIDARIIDVDGRILNRESMGEDLFWAIRGGGAASFGVIVSWNVRLIDVPEKVTVFGVIRPFEHDPSQLVHRWQHVAPQLDKDLFIGMVFNRLNASFYSLFLGGVDRLLPILQERFPELGIVREDCMEMSWIESTLYLSTIPLVVSPVNDYVPQPLEVLLNRTPANLYSSVKMRSDYVKEPIPEDGMEGIVRLLHEVESSELSVVYMMPYGGRMSEISESATPFPHRAGNLFKLACIAGWDDEKEDSDKYLSWSRRYYSYMTPYVSRSPREAYLNYRDLEIGANNVEGETSVEEASVWGRKYFKNNYDWLVRVKTVVDPDNFFKNEQSIPPLRSPWLGYE